jgi:hypothetical protein
MSFLDYFRTVNQANYLVSALNTNLVIPIHFDILPNGITCRVFRSRTAIIPMTADESSSSEWIRCGRENPVSTAGFYNLAEQLDSTAHVYWDLNEQTSKVVNGFFGGCTPLEALLQSTLDCFYDNNCLQLLFDDFPRLKQVCTTLSHLLFYIFFLLRYT